MKIKQDLIIYLFGLLVFLASCDTTPKSGFTYAEPETKGYSSQKLELLKEHLEKSGSSSMMIMVDGAIIFEWGETSKKHTIHSIRKALLNSLVGIAIEQGKIDTSLTLKQLGINDIEPKLSENEQQAKIIDLLKSRSGIYHDAAAVSEAMLRSKPKRNSFAPGEHYYYNNWDFNTMGAILEMQTGKSIYDLFNEEIAIPLGMKDYKGKYFTYTDGESSEDLNFTDEDGFYQYEKTKSKYPAYHFRMSAHDLMLYGQLYLNYGSWDGNQIVPKEWIDVSTKPYSNLQNFVKRGILWSVIVSKDDTKRNSFFHTGAGMHCLGVYPNFDMIYVHRVDTENKSNYNEGDFFKMLDFLFDSKIKK